ncbi:MAG: 23S rRNA (guanosine(2251)-2'-O)-methyltransferase RlmB [Dehalococcoidia bacterium]|nr:23S rRNA (guanosine(2251)-2'-O)-methyltransferase RlmB [Dehalococcoidia bacterium]
MPSIIEGKNPVIELLKSGHPVTKILLADGIKPGDAVTEILRLAQAQKIPLERVPRHIMDKQSTTDANQGVIAYAAVKNNISLDDLLVISAKKSEPPLYVILDGIEDPQNLGSILRTACASGIHGVIIRERRAAGLTASVAKASAGAMWYVPVASVSSIAGAIETLKKNNIWVIGIDRSGQVEYTQMDFRSPAAIVIGSEGKGLSELVRKRCDFLAHIPMQGEITSLNASVAAALVMYEAFKQRKGNPGI